MAEVLISVLLDQLASVVYQYTKERVKLVLDAKEDVEIFRIKLETIQDVLKDAEKKQVVDDKVKVWLEKLKDVSYEMDDVLDEWNTERLRSEVEEKQKVEETQKAKKVCFPMLSNCFCFAQVNKVIHQHDIAERINKLNERLTSIAAGRDMYGFQQTIIGGHDDQIQQQKTSSLVDISTIFGREEEKEMLLSKLLRESNRDGGRFLVIPIVGMGGMGKTTLTQLAYNHQKVTTHFDKKVWVCVSDPFDEIKIAKAIIEGLDKNETQKSSNELQTLLSCISSHVENKKFLLVLDDVWTEDQKQWENLKLSVIMQSCAQGSTILVTTRKEGVAKLMGPFKNMIHLDKLNDKDCLVLFNSIAFLDRERDEANRFGALGQEIVIKCKGLPLVVKTLASLVRYKETRKEWQDVLNSKIWELKEVEEQVFRPLLLSYYDLTPTLQQCLLYCAIFPKDHNIDKDDLINLWMSQGYLNSKKEEDRRKIGQNSFKSLVMRSFFQDFDKDDIGNVLKCKMHDIVHDFVRFLTEKEYMIIEEVKDDDKKKGHSIRHLTLTSLSQDPLIFPTFLNCKNMRTLTILDSKSTTVSPDLILQLQCVRTLNMSGGILCQLPDKINELIHLRYVKLSHNTGLQALPEALCDLYNLQTLDLRSCWALEKLPKGMGKLINLKHLYVMGCETLRYLPKGIGSLKSLQVLDWFKVCEGDDEEALKLRHLGNMDQLQGRLWIEILDASESEIEKAKFGNKEHLSWLAVCFKEDEDEDEDEEQRKGDEEIVRALQPHQNLESLYIWGCHATTESLYWIKSLHNLRQVLLWDWEYCELVPPLGKLPSLEILSIQGMKKVKKVGVEFLGIEEETETLSGILFPKLKKLSFDDMPNWEEWGRMIKDSSQVTIMPSLSYLRVSSCPVLKALPEFLYKITTLRTLTITDSPILEGEYEKDEGKEWHNISHIPNIRRQSESTWSD